MPLITRVSRLFRADLHAVLDRIEEPDVLLRQAVREMEEELVHDEQRARVLKHEYGQLTVRQTELERSLDEIEEELTVCFEAGEDDLARALIRRKLEAQRYAKFLSRKRDSLEESLGSLKARLDGNRARLDSMRQKAELLAEDEASHHGEDSFSAPDFSVRDEDVEVAFIRERQNRRPS